MELHFANHRSRPTPVLPGLGARAKVHFRRQSGIPKGIPPRLIHSIHHEFDHAGLLSNSQGLVHGFQRADEFVLPGRQQSSEREAGGLVWMWAFRRPVSRELEAE